MRHLKLFEDIKFGAKGYESYDKYVKKLYDDFFEAFDGDPFQHGVDDVDIIELFDEVQKEFDSGNAPEVYRIYTSIFPFPSRFNESPKDWLFRGLYKGDGPFHAMVRFMIDKKVCFSLYHDSMYKYSRPKQQNRIVGMPCVYTAGGGNFSHIDDKIEELEYELQLWKKIN